jgi:predicted ATP-dependent Lon-type protease
MPGPYFEDTFNSTTITTGLNLRKGVTVLGGSTVTAGGNTTPGVTFVNTTTATGLGIYFGSGAPTITAPQGSLYLNTTGSSTSTRAYINTTGSTTWTAITTAA